MASTPSSKFILIGEDDIDDQEFLGEMIISIDPTYKLQFITTGKKIISYLEELDNNNLPNLIVLDYNMPEFNGVEILKKISTIKRYALIPKILWSTSNSSVLKAECLRLGAEDFIVKPSNLKALEEIVKYMLSFAKPYNDISS